MASAQCPACASVSASRPAGPVSRVDLVVVVDPKAKMGEIFYLICPVCRYAEALLSPTQDAGFFTDRLEGPNSRPCYED